MCTYIVKHWLIVKLENLNGCNAFYFIFFFYQAYRSTDKERDIEMIGKSEYEIQKELERNLKSYKMITLRCGQLFVKF